jgi:hypothetical protein
MGALPRFAQKWIWRRSTVRNMRAKPSIHGCHDRTTGWGISLGPATRQASHPEPPSSVRFSLDLDVGEVALGHHLIVRAVSLTAKDLSFEYAFRPALTEEAHKEVWLNMFYDADISPPDWNYVGAEGDVQYARPPLEARHAWFDFFHPDYEWMEHRDQHGPDSDYLRNRIARLTVDLTTGDAQIEK